MVIEGINTKCRSDNVVSETNKVIRGINKAKAISAELLELSLKNKLEETGKTR